MTTPAALAVQLYTFRDEMAEDGAGALARLAGLGFTAVEPFGVGRGGPTDARDHARRLRRDLDAAGLIAPSVHTAAPLDDHTDQVLDAVEDIGAQTVVIPSPGAVSGFGHDSFTDPDSTRRLGERIGEAAQNAAGRGLRLAYHNHRGEFPPIDGVMPLRLLLDAAGPGVDVEVDVYWAQGGGASPRELVAELGDRVRLLHVKDGTGEHGVAQVPAGSGQVDNRGAIEAGSAVEWHVLEFDRCDLDRFEAVRASADWLVAEGLSTWSVEHG